MFLILNRSFKISNSLFQRFKNCNIFYIIIDAPVRLDILQYFEYFYRTFQLFLFWLLRIFCWFTKYLIPRMTIFICRRVKGYYYWKYNKNEKCTNFCSFTVGFELGTSHIQRGHQALTTPQLWILDLIFYLKGTVFSFRIYIIVC